MLFVIEREARYQGGCFIARPDPSEERRGLSVYRYALEHGALLRPLGDVIYFMPPYVIKPEEIDFLAKVAREGIEVASGK